MVKAVKKTSQAKIFHSGFQKIIIHPNRYLIWTLAIAVITAGALLSYISIAKIYMDNDLTIQPNRNFWHTYKGQELTLKYPPDWVVDPGNGYVGLGPKDYDVFVVYTYEPNEAVYESYLHQSKSRSITIGGTLGIAVKDPFSNQQIAFAKTAKGLYEFRGTASVFYKILDTVRFAK